MRWESQWKGKPRGSDFCFISLIRMISIISIDNIYSIHKYYQHWNNFVLNRWLKTMLKFPQQNRPLYSKSFKSNKRVKCLIQSYCQGKVNIVAIEVQTLSSIPHICRYMALLGSWEVLIKVFCHEDMKECDICICVSWESIIHTIDFQWKETLFIGNEGTVFKVTKPLVNEMKLYKKFGPRITYEFEDLLFALLRCETQPMNKETVFTMSLHGTLFYVVTVYISKW